MLACWCKQSAIPFLFVAPALYAIHALLAGVAYWVAIELGIHHSTTFSHGLIDYVVGDDAVEALAAQRSDGVRAGDHAGILAKAPPRTPAETVRCILDSLAAAYATAAP